MFHWIFVVFDIVVIDASFLLPVYSHAAIIDVPTCRCQVRAAVNMHTTIRVIIFPLVFITATRCVVGMSPSATRPSRCCCVWWCRPYIVAVDVIVVIVEVAMAVFRVGVLTPFRYFGRRFGRQQWWRHRWRMSKQHEFIFRECNITQIGRWNISDQRYWSKIIFRRPRVGLEEEANMCTAKVVQEIIPKMAFPSSVKTINSSIPKYDLKHILLNFYFRFPQISWSLYLSNKKIGRESFRFWLNHRTETRHRF